MGMLQCCIKSHFSTLSIDGPSYHNVEVKFHRDLISEWKNFKLQCIHGKDKKELSGIGQNPQFMLLNLWKLGKFGQVMRYY
jgi:hypothetical protein